LTHSRLKIHAGKANGGIAPHVDAQLVRASELGAHREPEAIAELCRLAPANIRKRRNSLPEWRELIARTACIMGDNRVGHVLAMLQIPLHAIRGDRRLVT